MVLRWADENEVILLAQGSCARLNEAYSLVGFDGVGRWRDGTRGRVVTVAIEWLAGHDHMLVRRPLLSTDAEVVGTAAPIGDI